ncbi:uncharacterized protein TNCV_1416501 [Trichonephila clavipes]|nr:uncharacterized protein TNCV_1416501 [Trichonephila clavipes]
MRSRKVWDRIPEEAAVAEWSRYRIMACLVTSSSPVPLKIRHVGERCTLNLSRAQASSRWCGVVVRRGGASSEGMDVCKCTVPPWHGGTLNSHRAASPLMRLVEGEERWDAPDHS